MLLIKCISPVFFFLKNLIIKKFLYGIGARKSYASQIRNKIVKCNSYRVASAFFYIFYFSHYYGDGDGFIRF